MSWEDLEWMETAADHHLVLSCSRSSGSAGSDREPAVRPVPIGLSVPIFGRCLVKISAGTPDSSLRGFVAFHTPFRQSTGVVPLIGQSHFLPEPLQLVIARHCILTSAWNNPQEEVLNFWRVFRRLVSRSWTSDMVQWFFRVDTLYRRCLDGAWSLSILRCSHPTKQNTWYSCTRCVVYWRDLKLNSVYVTCRTLSRVC
jgi:hypothetical protein